MAEDFLTSPTIWFQRYLKDHPGEWLKDTQFRLGQVAVGLELESQARIFESDELGDMFEPLTMQRLEFASFLRTLLGSLDVGPLIPEWYERIYQYRDSILRITSVERVISPVEVGIPPPADRADDGEPEDDGDEVHGPDQ